MDKQLEEWTGEFGNAYIERNPKTLDEMNDFWVTKYGMSRNQMNAMFIGGFPRDIKILEVGCNIGLQLDCLYSMGFTNLHGIEPNKTAVDILNSSGKPYRATLADGHNIPFSDGAFDLIFTSGVLIHVAEENLDKIMGEIFRCSREWILGLEYYSVKRREIPYRDKEGLLWADNYVAKYQKLFGIGNRIYRKKEITYKFKGDRKKLTTMFLLGKM